MKDSLTDGNFREGYVQHVPNQYYTVSTGQERRELWMKFNVEPTYDKRFH